MTHSYVFHPMPYHTCVAVCCSVLQCVAVCCSVLQCVAVCCSVLQCVPRKACVSRLTTLSDSLMCVAVCCSVLQCVAVRSTNGMCFKTDDSERFTHVSHDLLICNMTRCVNIWLVFHPMPYHTRVSECVS